MKEMVGLEVLIGGIAPAQGIQGPKFNPPAPERGKKE